MLLPISREKYYRYSDQSGSLSDLYSRSTLALQVINRVQDAKNSRSEKRWECLCLLLMVVNYGGRVLGGLRIKFHD
jgi:hypothetical protein